jgi:hypothetical protein
VEEICGALGISVRDLFFDAGTDCQEYRGKSQAVKAKREAVSQVKAAQADLLREAEAVIQAATGVDISGWTDQELNQAMEAVCRARKVLIEEERRQWMTS